MSAIKAVYWKTCDKHGFTENCCENLVTCKREDRNTGTW